MRAALLLLLLSAPAAAGDYAPLKGLLGTWAVDRDCKVMRDRILVEIVLLPNAIRASYFTVDKKKNLGKSEVFYNAESERYKAYTYLPQLKQFGVAALPGSLSVAGPDEDEPGLITVTGKKSAASGTLQLRLKEKNTKLSFSARAQTPLGAQNCSGTGVRQPAAKK